MKNKQYKIEIVGNDLGRTYVVTVHAKSKEDVRKVAKKKYPFCKFIRIIK